MKTKYFDFNTKSISESGGFEGYGSTYDKDHYNDVVVPGAYAKTLKQWKAKDRWPPLLFNHNSENPLGFYKDMKEDDKGLFVKGQLLIEEIQKAREIHALLKYNGIDGLSIGYIPVVEEYDHEEKVNYLKEIELRELSIVVSPANEAAVITDVKSIESIRDLEKALLDVGFSRKEAKAVAKYGYKGLTNEPSQELDEIKKLIENNINTLKV